MSPAARTAAGSADGRATGPAWGPVTGQAPRRVADPVGEAVTVFADHGVRGTRSYGPDGAVRQESTRWRGMCAQSRVRGGTRHWFADGADLLTGSPGSPALGRADRTAAERVLADPPPALVPAGTQRLDGLLSGLAVRYQLNLTWSAYRQRVAAGRPGAFVPDERRLATVEVADPRAPGCVHLLPWDDADTRGSAARVEEAAAGARELAAIAPGSPPGLRCDVVFEPGRAGSLFHELVGHPLEADIVAARSSYLAGRAGEQVGPAWLTVTDGAAPAGEGLSARVDDEGIPVSDVALIDRGRVGGVLCDALGAEALGLHGNGHGRRLDYRHPLIPRMWHTRAVTGGAEAREPSGAARLHPYGIRLRRMNLLTGAVEFAAADAVLDTGDERRRTGPCTISGRGTAMLAALQPGAPAPRGSGRASRGCGKLGQFPLVTTFSTSGIWIPGEVVDVRFDAHR